MPNGRSNGKSVKPKKKAERRPRVEIGSGNVFADIGLPNPELLLAKAKLVQRIRIAIEDRMLTSASAAQLLGIDQSKLSALVRGRTDGYTIDRLVRFLNALGRTVEITVRPIESGHAVVVT